MDFSPTPSEIFPFYGKPSRYFQIFSHSNRDHLQLDISLKTSTPSAIKKFYANLASTRVFFLFLFFLLLFCFLVDVWLTSAGLQSNLPLRWRDACVCCAVKQPVVDCGVSGGECPPGVFSRGVQLLSLLLGLNVSVPDKSDAPAEFFGTNDRNVHSH